MKPFVLLQITDDFYIDAFWSDIWRNSSDFYPKLISNSDEKYIMLWSNNKLLGYIQNIPRNRIKKVFIVDGRSVRLIDAYSDIDKAKNRLKFEIVMLYRKYLKDLNWKKNDTEKRF
jgi:hypothetical protein